MMWTTCEWRKKVGANGNEIHIIFFNILIIIYLMNWLKYDFILLQDINEDNVNREYLEDGVCFAYGKDKDGKNMFVIKSKLHTKGARDFGELQRCIIYWFERLQRYFKYIKYKI